MKKSKMVNGQADTTAPTIGTIDEEKIQQVLRQLRTGARVLVTTQEGEAAAEELVKRGWARKSGGAYVTTELRRNAKKRL